MTRMGKHRVGRWWLCLRCWRCKMSLHLRRDCFGCTRPEWLCVKGL